MAPTKRVDDPGHDDGVSLPDERRTTRTIRASPGPRVLDDALRSGSTTVDVEGGRYLGFPQKRPWRAMHQQSRGAPDQLTGLSDRPNKPGAAQRFQIWTRVPQRVPERAFIGSDRIT